MHPLILATLFVFSITLFCTVGGFGLRYLANSVEVSDRSVSFWNKLNDLRDVSNVLLKATLWLVMILGILLFVDVGNDTFGELWMNAIAIIVGSVCVLGDLAVLVMAVIWRNFGYAEESEEEPQIGTPTHA
jgi:hypothetical protein